MDSHWVIFAFIWNVFNMFLGFLWIIFMVKQIFLRKFFSLRSNLTLNHEFILLCAMFTSSYSQYCTHPDSSHYFIVINLYPRWTRSTFFVVMSRTPVLSNAKNYLFQLFSYKPTSLHYNVNHFVNSIVLRLNFRAKFSRW